MAVAVFRTPKVEGDVLFYNTPKGVRVCVQFTKLPHGEHGFHIHKAGDLRGDGCKAACEHFSIDPLAQHGGPPGSGGERHTGDLGNVSCDKGVYENSYYLSGLSVHELWGRSVIVHADPDDLGKGSFEDSLTTGHSGKRIACAIIGRTSQCK
jgi:Cu-Zn family superoxide dismutase